MAAGDLLDLSGGGTVGIGEPACGSADALLNLVAAVAQFALAFVGREAGEIGVVDRVRAKSDGRRKRGGLVPAHELKDGGFGVGLTGPVVLAAAVFGDEKDGSGKVVLGEDWDGVVDEVGEAVVEGDSYGTWLGESLSEGDDGDAC